MVYVSNTESNSVSTIDGSTDKVVAGITFNVNPATSGHITCNNEKEFPLNLYLYVGLGTKCIAQSNKGFVFSSWVENLGHMSSQTLNVSTAKSDALTNIFV